LRRLKRGLPVIANYPLLPEKIPNSDLFHYWDNSEIEPSRLMDFSRHYFEDHRFREDQILLVLDEVQLLHNSRLWSVDKSRMDWISFYSQHRKAAFSIILVAQFDKMVDRQIRSLIEYEYIHRKVSNFGVTGWLLSLLFGGKAHVCIQKYYPLNEKIGAQWFVARKRIFECYDSYGQFAGSGAADQGGAGSGDRLKLVGS
jgi:zona occludens toxin (predicted ATPase)